MICPVSFTIQESVCTSSQMIWWAKKNALNDWNFKRSYFPTPGVMQCRGATVAYGPSSGWRYISVYNFSMVCLILMRVWSIIYLSCGVIELESVVHSPVNIWVWVCLSDVPPVEAGAGGHQDPSWRAVGDRVTGYQPPRASARWSWLHLHHPPPDSSNQCHGSPHQW